MTAIEARTAVAEASLVLGAKGVLEVVTEHLDTKLEDATAAGDKWARAQLAHDHRALVNLTDKLQN